MSHLTQAIKHDHQEMYEYYDNYLAAKGNVDAQARWVRQLTWEVARHAAGEEIVVYPLMEKHLGAEGRQLADHDRAEHQIVKELLYKLEGLSAGTTEYDDTVKQVMDHLRPHNDSEETTDLPKLEAQLGDALSEKSARSFELTKKFVPTRAHPSAPDKPPYETLVGFLATPIDKLKDMFAKFPTEDTPTADNR